MTSLDLFLSLCSNRLVCGGVGDGGSFCFHFSSLRLTLDLFDCSPVPSLRPLA